VVVQLGVLATAVRVWLVLRLCGMRKAYPESGSGRHLLKKWDALPGAYSSRDAIQYGTVQCSAVQYCTAQCFGCGQESLECTTAA
jgi:hypothetical protein